MHPNPTNALCVTVWVTALPQASTSPSVEKGLQDKAGEGPSELSDLIKSHEYGKAVFLQVFQLRACR